jgi:fatty acid desaturase
VRLGRKPLSPTGRSDVNDRVADALAAWPVLSEVHRYAETHIPHHINLGSDGDTDLLRWRELRIELLDRTRRSLYLIGIAQRLARYVPGWWKAIGVRRATVARFCAWHGAWLSGLALWTSPREAGAVWLLGWFVPLTLVLPVLRFIGEIEEHSYSDSMTVFTSTYTNIGFWQRLVFHPHNDAFHTVHHLFPSVPFFRVRRLHRHLVEREPALFGRRVPIRHSVVDAWGAA